MHDWSEGRPPDGAARRLRRAAQGLPGGAYGAPPFPPGPPGLPPLPPVPPGPPGPPGTFGPGPLGATPRVKRGDVRAAALALLAEGPCNGYQIIQQIALRSHGIWRPSPGSVYPALQQLEDEGLVRGEEDNGRRIYHLTDAGHAHLEEREGPGEPWDEVAESVSEEMVDLNCSLAEVAMAMRQVMAVGTSAQLGDARKILADARRALYRLLAEDPEENE